MPVSSGLSLKRHLQEQRSQSFVEVEHVPHKSVQREDISSDSDPEAAVQLFKPPSGPTISVCPS